MAMRLFRQSLLPVTESEGSADEQDKIGQSAAEERRWSSKRKRTAVETERDEDLDADGIKNLIRLGGTVPI